VSETPSITVYGVMSPNVLKVVILLEELALPYRLRYVNLFKGEQFSPEFLQLNPLGKVPVLLDGRLKQPLAESGAILFWLAEQAGRFLAASGDARYEVMQWLMVQMSAVGPMLGQFTHFSLLPAGSEPYARGRYEALAKRLYAQINDRVANRAWLAGDDYSIADIATFPWGEYIDRHGFDPGDYPALMRWRERINNRPAVQKAKAVFIEALGAPSAESLANVTAEDLDRFFGMSKDMPQQDFSAVTRMKS
jgi:GSH-dependent disulfide-bond oxidoreductase